MSEYTTIQNNFSAGVIDPILFGAINSQLYACGAKTLKNFVVDPNGYLFRRPGTKYANFHVTSSYCRVKTLNTPDGALNVIFGDKVVWLFLQSMSLFHQLVTPYSLEDLPKLNIAEFESALYLIHEDYPPYILKSSSTTGFSYTLEVKETVLGYQAITEAEKEIYADSTYISGTWTCEPITFTGDILFNDSGHYPTCQTFKGGRWYLSGCRENPSTIYASRSPDSEGYRFFDFTLSKTYLVKVEATLTKTTTYEDSTQASIKDVQYSSSTLTSSDIYDPTVAVPENSTTTETVTSSDGLTKIETTTAITYSVQVDDLTDYAIELTEADLYGSKINWLFTQQRVIAGSSRDVWMDSGEAATPSTFDMSRTVGASTSDVNPVLYGSMLFFTSSNKRHVRAIYYNSDAGGYQYLDISSAAKHLFTSNIREMAIMEGELTILWVLLEEGKLLSCTLTGSTYGWAEHEIGGNGIVKTINVYHGDEDSDVLYLMVDRGHATTAGDPILYLETLSFESLHYTDYFTLLDGCISAEATQTEEGTIHVDLTDTTLHEFMAGDELQIVTDGWVKDGVIYPETSSTALIEIDIPEAEFVTIGFPIEAVAEMLVQELPSNSASSLGKKRSVISVDLKVYRTGGGYFGYESEVTQFRIDGAGVVLSLPESESYSEEFQTLMATGKDIESVAAEYYTGLIRLPIPSYTSADVHAVIKTTKPMPLTIQAILTKYSIREG